MERKLWIPKVTFSWLLEPDDLGVRYLAMRDLCNESFSPAEQNASRQAAHTSGQIAQVLDAMEPQGYWSKPGSGYNPKYYSSVWSLVLLAQLGASVRNDERILRACEYMLEHGLTKNGQFTSSGAPSGTMDCLQGNLCLALQDLGVVDNRLDLALEWMARSITGDGIAPLEEKNAGLRYYAGNCGPLFACGANMKEACAWGAAKELLAMSKIPEEQRTEQVRKAISMGVDFLFSCDPARAEYPSPWTGKPSGNWWKFGFPVFYVTDLLQVVESLARLGYGSDPRLQNALQLIIDKRDEQGRWMMEYSYEGKTWGYYGEKRQPNKWVTLRVLNVLKLAGVEYGRD